MSSLENVQFYEVKLKVHVDKVHFYEVNLSVCSSQENPGDRQADKQRRAQESPREPRRNQESPGQPRRGQESPRNMSFYEVKLQVSFRN